MVSQNTMKALQPKTNGNAITMSRNERSIQRIREEFAKFERTMEELRLLKSVAEDLKSFRKMLRLKKYD